MTRSQQLKAAAVAILAGTVGAANAAPLTLPTELTDALTSVGVIGAGVFAIAVGVRVYKWARSAL